MGTAHLNGNGVKRDIAAGERWLLTAAEQNHAPAQCDLGALYLDGSILKQDYFAGTKWLEKAADQGDALAMAGLGSIYGKGFREKGVGFFQRMMYANMSVDRVESCKWFTLALQAGHASAQKDLWLLRRLMTPAQIETAEGKVKAHATPAKRA